MNQSAIDIPTEIVWRWQEIVSLTAEIMEVPAALVTKVQRPELGVFVASKSEGNPFNNGDKGLLAGVYCEGVIDSRRPLLVPDALSDPAWKHTPELEFGMVSYLGFPVAWPDGTIFGTICVFDRVPNGYSEKYQEFLRHCRDVVETDLYFLAMRDVRFGEDRKRLEEQLWQSQKMESVGQLSGGVAHDFNNILTVIEGHASRIRKIENLPPAVEESIKEILEATDRASGLTHQLLTFGRKATMKTRPVDLNGVIENIARMLRRMLGAAIVLRVETAGDLPKISADAGMIGQVLLYLAINARGSMPNGGRMMISTRVAGPESGISENDDRTGWVEMMVSDTGRGIPPESVPNIFQPFFARKEAGAGTGLGLITVSEIVNEHRGRIVVKSEVGRGTTFQIFFPLAGDAEGAEEPKLLGDGMTGGNETILVVEDEPAVRALIVQSLREAGYSTLEADSGTQALTVFEEHPSKIDLLLTDLEMPEGISGKQLWEELRSRVPEMAVVFTGGNGSGTAGLGQMSSEVSCLPKPFSTEALAGAVRKSLDARPKDAS